MFLNGYVLSNYDIQLEKFVVCLNKFDSVLLPPIYLKKDLTVMNVFNFHNILVFFKVKMYLKSVNGVSIQVIVQV